jgi:hypothetical protein
MKMNTGCPSQARSSAYVRPGLQESIAISMAAF